MKGLTAAVMTSMVCFAMHYVLIRFGVIRVKADPPIRKLIIHWRLLAVIWIVALPLYLYGAGPKGAALQCEYGAALPATVVFFYGVILFAAFFFCISRSITWWTVLSHRGS